MEKIEEATRRAAQDGVINGHNARLKQRTARWHNALDHAEAASDRWARLLAAGDRPAAAVWDHLACLCQDHAHRLARRVDRIHTVENRAKVENRVVLNVADAGAAADIVRVLGERRARLAKGGSACTP